MSSVDLEVNSRIEVIVEEKSYRSLIIDIDEEFIQINLPVNDGQYLMLHQGEKVEMNSYSKSGKCFNFFCNVISKGKEGNILYYKLTPPYNIKNIQRRNFFRVSIVNFIEYKNITNIDKEEINQMPYEKALMIDLSAGGIRLKLKKDIELNNLLLIKIDFKGMEMVLKGEIVRVENTEDKEKICGVKFIDITQKQCDRIIEELFAITRRQRANL